MRFLRRGLKSPPLNDVEVVSRLRGAACVGLLEAAHRDAEQRAYAAGSCGPLGLCKAEV